MHEVVDAISLKLAQEVAARVQARPELVEVARETLTRWMQRNAGSHSLMRCYQEWESILKKPVEEVCAILCAETDEGQRLRQNSPFVGILSPEEVWDIKRERRKREKAGA
jgi:hypothetical protein